MYNIKDVRSLCDGAAKAPMLMLASSLKYLQEAAFYLYVSCRQFPPSY